MISLALFSSASVEHSTPHPFWQTLDVEFNFGLDACATCLNTKCRKFFSKNNDGLTNTWCNNGPVWLNPPYGRQIGLWVKKAYEESRLGATVVCLLPARTDTKWFQDYCLPFGEVRFVRGRLKFGGAKSSAPFPSVVVIFRPPNV